MRIQTIDTGSYKIGLNEIKGLRSAMLKALKPIETMIQDKAYWTRGSSIIEMSEYLRRDGFIPHSDNFGGLEIRLVIPKSEEYEFSFLEFGEWDGTHYCDEKDKDNCECPYDQDGEYDSQLRIWLKFEGLDEETGSLKFYLYMGGGNGDAPYFRTKYESDIFEAEFQCKSIQGINRAASKHIKKVLSILEGNRK